MKVHIKNLLKKLKFRSRLEAAVWAIDQNLRPALLARAEPALSGRGARRPAPAARRRNGGSGASGREADHDPRARMDVLLGVGPDDQLARQSDSPAPPPGASPGCGWWLARNPAEAPPVVLHPQAGAVLAIGLQAHLDAPRAAVGKACLTALETSRSRSARIGIAVSMPSTTSIQCRFDAHPPAARAGTPAAPPAGPGNA